MPKINMSLAIGLNKHQGFSLIEVMIALVILSIGLGALIVSSTQNIRVYQRLQQRHVQAWVSLNVINQVQLHQIKILNTLPRTGSQTMRGIKCYWQAQKYATPTPHLYKIAVATKMKAIGPYEKVNWAYYYE